MNRLRRLTQFTLLLSAMFIAPPVVAQSKVSKTPAQKQMRRLKNLKNTARRDPYTRNVIRNVLKDRDRTITSVGKVSAARIRDRIAWVPLGVDPELRKVTVATVLRKMNQSSRRLRATIRRRPAEAVWDVVFVGAGVHTAIAANALSSANEVPMKMLTIEASNTVAQTFRSLGDTLARNSANRADVEGAAIERGFGNKNPSLGPWGDPDLAGSEWPGVKGFADVATINLFASGTDTLMKTRVSKVKERGPGDNWPTRYRVETKDGLKIYANQVVTGTGLGTAKIPTLQTGGEALVAKVRKTIDYSNPDKVPTILTAEEALRLGNLSSTGRDAYRIAPAAGPKTSDTQFSESEGLQVDTNISSRLQGQGFDIGLAKITNFKYREQTKDWEVSFVGGTKVTPRLNLLVGSSLVPVKSKEDLSQLAKRLKTIKNVRDAEGRSTALKVSVRSVRLRTPIQTKSESNTSRELRLALFRSIFGIVDDMPVDGVFTTSAGILNLDAVQDVASDGKRFTILLDRGTSKTITTETITISNQAITADDPRFQTGPLNNSAVIAAQGRQVLRAGGVTGELLFISAGGGQIAANDIAKIRTIGSTTTLTTTSGQELALGTAAILTYKALNGRNATKNFASNYLVRIGASVKTQQKSRPTIAVIGGGDSARTFLEYLYGQAPESAYTGPGKRDTAQRGDIGDITWVVGDKGPADCNTFLQTTRSRYLRLTGKVRDQPGSPSRAKLLKRRLQQVKKIETGINAGRYEITVGNQVSVVDRVIFATGYENQVLNLFDGDQTRLEAIQGTLPNLEGERTLAKRVEGQDIYLIGPAAGGDVVGADERFNTNENAAALFAFRDRNVAVVDAVISKGPRALTTLETSSINRPGRTKITPLGSATGKAATFRPKLDKQDGKLLEATTLTSVVLKAEMADVLDSFRFPGITELEVTISAQSDGQLSIRSPRVSSKSMMKVAQAINKSPILTAELGKFLEPGEAIKFTSKIRKGSSKPEWDGLVRTSSMRIEY